MYTSDLTALLQMLQETKANDVLSTIWTGPGGPWQALLTVRSGQVTASRVWSSLNEDSLLTHGDALHWLAGRGTLTWERAASLQQDPSRRLLPPSRSVSPSTIEVPRRIIQVEKEEMLTWLHKQRQVFALIDGQRSIDRIAEILCQPLIVVEDITLDLQSRGVIAVERRSPELREEGGVA